MKQLFLFFLFCKSTVHNMNKATNKYYSFHFRI
jgi:hypothetical protein